MAHDTAKKNNKKNLARLWKFRLITLVVNAVYCFFTIIFNQSFVPGMYDVLGLLFWFSQEWIAITLLKVRGAPTTDEASGEIIDCADLSKPEDLGYYSWAQDMLWICWVVQLLVTIVSPYFWAIYAIIPLFGLYKAWSFVIYPLLSHLLGGRKQQMPEGMPPGGQPMPDDMDPRSRLAMRRQDSRRGNQQNVRKR